MRNYIVTLLAAFLLGEARGEEEEHHHEHAFEWAGVFDIQTAGYGHSIVIQRHGDMAASFATGLIVVPTGSGDLEGLEEAEEAIEVIAESANATDISGVYVKISTGVMYEVSLSNRSWVSSLGIFFPAPGFYAIFLEHAMDELCPDGECFRDSSGTIMEPLVVETAHEDHTDSTRSEWGVTMGGAVVVWAAVFSGIVLLGGGTEKYYALSDHKVHLISMFAAGALLSTAFCLILIEASHFISSGDRDEAEVAGIWGSVILVGFLTATIIDMVKEGVMAVLSTNGDPVSPPASTEASGSPSGSKGSDMVAYEENGIELGSAKAPALAGKLSDGAQQKANGIVISILAGDFLHNFCDGVFIGAAFQSCSHSLGWTIVATTACHEFAQEIADFIILTKMAKLRIPTALFINALSGLSVIIGGIVVSATSLSDLSIGILLAFGSGNYIYLAAAELFPSVHSDNNSMSVGEKLLGLVLFIIGACAVGLVLLNHEHCEVSSDSSGGDGHNH